MMERCSKICKEKGLKANQYKKSMLDFKLQRKFNLVILCSGGLGLFTKDKEINKVFNRVSAHLNPGGLFIFEFEPVPLIKENNMNTINWSGDWINGPDGAVIAWRNRSKYNSATYVWEKLFVIEKYVKGRLVETEANERTGRYFTADEAEEFAMTEGFENIKLTNWLTQDPPNENSKVITVCCRKSG
jgi:hypothetical protein